MNWTQWFREWRGMIVGGALASAVFLLWMQFRSDTRFELVVASHAQRHLTKKVTGAGSQRDQNSRNGFVLYRIDRRTGRVWYSKPQFVGGDTDAAASFHANSGWKEISSPDD